MGVTLTEQQFADLKRRRSTQDLNDLLAVLERDGSIAVEGGGSAIEGDDEDAVKAAEEARDTAIANSRLLSESADGPAAPSDEELKGNLEAAKAAGEVDEEATKTRTRAAAAQGE